MYLVISYSIRIIHTSDTHGNLYGNLHDKDQDAKFGDVLSFISYQKQLQPTIAFDSGDFIQGSGLSDASKVIGEVVMSAWQQSFQYNEFYDTVTYGNHDLTVKESIMNNINNFFTDPNVNSKSTAFNTFVNDGVMTNRYKLIKVDGQLHLIIGLMYKMNTPTPINIIQYQKELGGQLFQSLIQQADIIIFLFHTGLHQHPEQYDEIYRIVRRNTHKPIIILGGHEHQNAYQYGCSQTNFINPYTYLVKDGKDINCVYMESENYLKSISILDFTVQHGIITKIEYKSIKGSVKLLLAECKLEKFENLAAENIQLFINQRVEEFGLKNVVGKAPQTYYYLEPNDKNESSSYNLWMREITPKILYTLNESGKLKNEPINIIGTSFFNTDIFKGSIFKDDLFVTIPYQDEFYYSYGAILGKHLKQIYCLMIEGCDSVKRAPTGFKKYFISKYKELDDNKNYSLLLTNYDAKKFLSKAELLNITVIQDPGNYGNISPFTVYQQFVEQYWKL